MPSLDVHLLGGLRVILDGKPLSGFDSPRLRSLLAYLLLHRHTPQPRRHVAFLFWPDSTEAQARTNLRQLLHQLRHTLPHVESFARLEGKTLHWRDDAPFTLDVATFAEQRALADRAEETGHEAEVLAALRRAEEAYGGDLLPSSYDEWIVPERERLRGEYTRVLDRLIEHLEERRDYTGAIRYAERLLRHDPLDEATCRRLMNLHAMNGDRPRALRVYHACAAALQRELDVEPSAETRDIYERILRADHAPERADQRVGAGRAVAKKAPSVSRPLPGKTRVVGRMEEWGRLQDAWRAAAGGNGPGLVLFAGEPGVGKSRLAEEFAAWVAQQGLATARSRSYEAEGRLPYAPVVDWLRAPPLEEAVRDLEPVWLGELARLLPEVLVRRPDLPAPGPLTEAWQRRRVFEAVARAILAVEQPLLLVVDDLQWTDGETLELLHFLLRFDPGARLLVLGTARTGEVEAGHPLATLLQALRHDDRVAEIELGPLSPDETVTLAARVAEREVPEDEGRDLYRETEGNPLFIVESMRAGLEGAGGLPGATSSSGAAPVPGPAPWSSGARAERSLPPRVRTVLRARLAQLTPGARELAGLASVIGREFTFDVLRAAGEAQEDDLVRGLDELWHRRIIREQGAEAYDFTHDKLREVAYADLGAHRRRGLHRRVARALETVRARDLDEESARIAAHYDRAGRAEEAVSFYRRAAEVAQQVGANEEAAASLRRGLALLGELPEGPERDERELGLQTALGVSLVAVKGYPADEVRKTYDRARELCLRLGRPVSPPVLRGLAIADVASGRLEETRELGLQLAEAAREADDPVLRTEGDYVLGVALFWLGDLETSRRHLERAVDGYDPRRHRTHASLFAQDPGVVCGIRLALCLWCLGRTQEAVETRRRALDLARELEHPLSHAYALNYAAWIDLERGELEEARACVEALVARAAGQQLGFWPPTGRILRGWLSVEDGDVREGIAEMEGGVRDHLSTGQNLHLIYGYVLLARGRLRADDPEGALDALDRARKLIERTGQRFWEAEVLRREGEIRLRRGASGDREAAGDCFRRALETARGQGAGALEARAVASLEALESL
jgi:DNA-binding SARP family transcriptional activator/predicted ATPase